MQRRVIIRVRVALAAVLHEKAGIIPRHAGDALGLMEQDMSQHPPVTVHDDHLPVRRAKQHLGFKTTAEFKIEFNLFTVTSLSELKRL